AGRRSTRAASRTATRTATAPRPLTRASLFAVRAVAPAVAGTALAPGSAATGSPGADLVVQPQGECDALTLHVDLEDLHPHDVTGLDDVVRVLDELVRHRGHVHQTVLVDADVDEGAEGRHVGDDAFQAHAGNQVADLFYAVAEGRCGERRPRVTARLAELGQHVGDRGQAEGVVDEVGRAQPAQRLRPAQHTGEVAAGGVDDAADERIRLGMHTGGVQGVVTVADTQEPGALFEGLRPEPGNILQRRARAERSVRLAVLHDRLRQPGADTRHAGQQRRRGGVQVDADGVDAVLDHG